MVNVNYIAILICGVVFMGLGTLWYSPVLFGKEWMKLVGKKKEDMAKPDMIKMMLVPLVGALLMSYVLSVIFQAIHPVTIVDGAIGGFWTWLGFVATTGFINSSFQDKPLKLFYIDTGYYLVSLVLFGMILTIFR